MEMSQDIDLYAEVDDFGANQDPEYNNNEGADLYDDVLAPSDRRASDAASDGNAEGAERGDNWKGAEGDHQESHSGHHASSGPTPLGPDGRPERRFGLYIGNLTWWTTDQDITDAINGLGVTDITDIKFFENRANGQSKGFCVVNINTEPSWKKVMEELPKLELHGQNPAVTHCNKQTLNYFEVQSRKMNPNAPGNNGTDNNGRPNNGSMNNGSSYGYQGHPGASGGPPQRPWGPGPPGMRAPLIPRPPRPDGSSSGYIPGSRPPGMYQGGGYQGWRPRGPPPGAPYGHSGPPPPGMGQRPPMMRPRGPPPHGQPLLRAPGPPPMDHNRGYDSQSGSWDHHSGHGHPSGQGMSSSQVHVNPAFFSSGRDADRGSSSSYDRGHSDRSYHDGGDHRRYDSHRPSVTEAEFDEIMHKNRSVCDSATERAIAAAGAGDTHVAIETLETAISVIKGSKISSDERCKALVSSLEDTLHGIASKGRSSGGGYGSHSSRPRSRSPMRDSRRRTRSRSKGRKESRRSRSRDRDRYSSSHRSDDRDHKGRDHRDRRH